MFDLLYRNCQLRGHLRAVNKSQALFVNQTKLWPSSVQNKEIHFCIHAVQKCTAIYVALLFEQKNILLLYFRGAKDHELWNTWNVYSIRYSEMLTGDVFSNTYLHIKKSFTRVLLFADYSFGQIWIGTEFQIFKVAELEKSPKYSDFFRTIG